MNAAIGEICVITSPYFDIKTNQNSFKLRPALVISELRNNDYCVLPISRVTRRENLDAYITGEVCHELFHYIKENKINVIAGGHYQTETVGVNSVMTKMMREKKLEAEFIDIPTGL